MRFCKEEASREEDQYADGGIVSNDKFYVSTNGSFGDCRLRTRRTAINSCNSDYVGFSHCYPHRSDLSALSMVEE